MAAKAAAAINSANTAAGAGPAQQNADGGQDCGQAEQALWLQCGALQDYYQDCIDTESSSFLEDILAVNRLCLDVMGCTNTCSNVHTRLYGDVLPVCGSVKGQASVDTMEMRQRAGAAYYSRYGLPFAWENPKADLPDHSKWDV